MAAGGSDEASFRVWVRRVEGPDAPYAVRFDAGEGKGILRVARPGILIDPPARPTGLEERLTGGQVRATRFLHVWEAGKQRRGHLLSRLDDATLEALPRGAWVELVPEAEAQLHYLLVPSASTTLEAEEEEITSPSQWVILRDFQRELRALQDARALGPNEPVVAVMDEPSDPHITPRGRVPTMPDLRDPDLGVHRSATTLVRHFRRRNAEDRERITALEAQIRELEARLAELRRSEG